MAEQWIPADGRARSRKNVAVYTLVGGRMVLTFDAIVTDVIRLLPALEDARDGINSSFGGGGTSGGDVSDPTWNAVAARDEGRTDRAARDLDTFARSWNQVLVGIKEMDRIRQGLVDPTPVPRQCCNEHGCPAGNRPAAGRGGRCEACYRSLLRNGEDRTEVGRQSKAVAA